MREITPTYEWIEQIAPGTLIPPLLYNPPADGWLKWASRLTDQSEAKPNTVSGNMIESYTPGWAQWIALKTALMLPVPPTESALDDVMPRVVSAGRCATVPEKAGIAREVVDPERLEEHAPVKAAFEGGRPIPIVLHTCVERFTSFVPVVRCDSGEGVYIAGSGDALPGSVQVFKAESHADALSQAAEWHDRKRDEEIAAKRRLAEDHAEKVPLIYLDLAVLQLRHDHVLYDEMGDLCAALNGGHGFYLVVGDRWCYALQISPGPAARFAILSAMEDKTRLLLRPDEMAAFASLEGWEESGDGGFRWESGAVEAVKENVWRLVFGLSGSPDARPVALVRLEVKQVADGRVEKTVWQVNVIDARKKVLASSLVPPRWIEEYDQDELKGAALAWAVWRTARKKRGEEE